MYEKENHLGVVISGIREASFFNIRDILYCESRNNSTIYHFSDGNSVLTCKTIKKVEKELSPHGFFRTHRRYLVNLKYLRFYSNSLHASVRLSNEASIPVSFRKKKKFLDAIKKIFQSGGGGKLTFKVSPTCANAQTLKVWDWQSTSFVLRLPVF